MCVYAYTIFLISILIFYVYFELLFITLRLARVNTVIIKWNFASTALATINNNK